MSEGSMSKGRSAGRAAVVALAAAFLIVPVAPGRAEEPGPPSYSWEEVMAFSIEKKDQLVEWLDRSLGELDEDTAAELQEQRRTAAAYMDDLRTATAENWEKLKRRAVGAVEDLQEAYQSAGESGE